VVRVPKENPIAPSNTLPRRSHAQQEEQGRNAGHRDDHPCQRRVSFYGVKGENNGE